MSYSFRLRASGGSLQVENLTGEIPDGEFGISGHEDDASVSIGVSRFSVTGVVVAQTSSNALKSFTAKAES